MPTNSFSETFPELLTPHEAAKLLKVSRSVIYRLKDSRVLRFYIVSSSIRFRKDDLLRYLEQQEKESKASQQL